MIELAITGGTVKIDECDLELFNNYTWYIKYQHLSHKRKYVVTSIQGTTLKLGDLLLGAKDGYRVLYRNKDGTDCTRNNLVLATYRQQQTSARKREGTMSKYRGVHFDKARGLWRAAISLEGRTKNLGRYANEIDAAKEYDKFAIEQFGEFASPNFPEDYK